MEKFSIKTRLTPEAYQKHLLRTFCKMRGLIIATFVGLALLVAGFVHFSDKYATLYLTIGAVLFFIIPLITHGSIKKFKSNLNFQNDIIYTFSENSVLVECTTLKSEFNWNNFIKIEKRNNFLVLYFSKYKYLLVDITQITAQQFDFISSKIQ